VTKLASVIWTSDLILKAKILTYAPLLSDFLLYVIHFNETKQGTLMRNLIRKAILMSDGLFLEFLLKEKPQYS